MKSLPFKKAKHIIEILTQKGFKAYIAGGAVRDMIAGENPSDFDIVTDAGIDEIQKIFHHDKVKKTGRSFTICMVDKIEIASCRTTSLKTDSCRSVKGNTDETDQQQDKQKIVNLNYGKIVKNHDQQNYAENIFPDIDLGKRDFTINSMAFDIFSQKIIDPFSGQKDLKNKIIRFTGNPKDRLTEDPLRMIRACRFAAKIKGKIFYSSLDAIKQHGESLIKAIAPERIRLEILKSMEYEKPSLFFHALHRTCLLQFIFPCLDRCYDLDGGPHHGETVFEHCMLAGDALSTDNPLLRLAGYLHDAGKYDAAEIKDGRLTFPSHEKKSGMVLSDLKKLKFSSREINYIDSMIYVHMRPLAEDTTPRAVRKILALLEEKGVSYKDFLRMRIADKKGNRAKKPYTFRDIRIRVEKFTSEIYGDKNAAFSIKDLKITGNHVMEITGLPPGPMIGMILQQVFEKVMDDPDLNNLHDLKQLVFSFYNGLIAVP